MSLFAKRIVPAAMFLLWLTACATVPSVAQTYTDLHDFLVTDYPNEFLQVGTIPQGRDGKYYGISHFGGTSGIGSVYSVTSSGTVTGVASLSTTNGGYPYNGLTLGTDGNFYGTAPLYGSGGAGTLFKVTPAGVLTILHNFSNTGDGGWPSAPPVQGNDGNYYGIASGNDQGTTFPATFYKLTPAGTFTTLHTFTTTEGSQCPGTMLLGSDGNFYSTCNTGGTSNQGTLVKIATTGTVTVLHDFAGTDGLYPDLMTQGADGNYYGVTQNGGSAGDGVVFQWKSSGGYKVLYNFTGGANGGIPVSGLTLGPDGKLYGTTSLGGSSTNCAGGCGTIFSVTTTGVLKTVYNFDNTTGSYPSSDLTLSTDGLLYGVAEFGGANNQGAFYSLNVGFAPFITLQSTSGKVGSQVGILGQGFTSSSQVKFNGTAATKVVLSGSSYLTATVPTGATNGFVTVTTGSTTLTSNQKYTVHNSWSSGASMPTAVQGTAVGVIGGKVYVVGGATNASTVAINQIYNPATNSWTTGASMPTARFVAASAVVNNILYVIGGNLDGSNQTNVVEAYSPSTNTWTTKSPMPTSRDSVSAAVKNGVIYVIGGYSGGSRLATVESYNPSTDSWAEEAPLLNAKSEPAVGLLSSTIVAAGGLENGGTTGENEGYNSTTNSWSTLTSDPTARQSTCSAVIAGLLYSAAGTDGTPLSTNESFNATSDKWTTTLAPIPLPVVAPGGTTTNNQLYCFGGSNNGILGQGTVYNNVQIYQP